MAVRLVIFDCDRTLWDHHNVSGLQPPFRKIDADTVEDAGGVQVRLRPGARDLLDALRQRRVLVSLASWNKPEPVFAILELLGLRAFFTRPKVEFHPYKERMIPALLDELAQEGIILKPEEVLYVDDRPLHLRRVKAILGPVRTLQAGADIADLREVVQHLDS